MTDVQDGIRMTKTPVQDDDMTGPIMIPSRFRQAPPSVPAPAQQGGRHARGPAPMPMGPYPVPVPAAPRNGFGIAALCLGLVGLVFMLMPITGFIAVILGGLALIFGLLGWARARRGQATNRKTAITGTVLGALGMVVGVIGVVIVFQATAQLSSDLDRIAGTAPSSGTTPYVGAPAAPAAPAATSYTYEVTGNYRATMLSFTDSNGDMTMLNETGNVNTMGSKLPWSKTVTPEPNGKFQSLNASMASTKGDSWITCTIKDNTGAVVATETGRGAYAGCYASTPFN